MRSSRRHMRKRRRHLREARIARKHGNDKLARHHLNVAQRELTLARKSRARAKARKRRAGPSGLTAAQRIHARKRAAQAAFLGVRNRGVIHYTQGGSRWQGIRGHFLSKRGQFPRYADCSSFSTWCLWNALKVGYGLRDVVNGTAWTAGYTGTLLNHGKRVRGKRLPGDLVFYGRGFPGHHVAIYVGNGMVVSHGSEAGPLYCRWNYRSDYMQTRRYI